MALQSSGPISLLDIQNEFGGSAPISLSEYYGAAAGVPSSGSISLSNFYGTSSVFSHTISSSQKELNLYSYLVGQGWNGSDPVDLTVSSNVYLWSDNTSTAGLTISSSFSNLLTLRNYGKIIGRGGNGGNAGSQTTNPTAPTAGGPAVSNSASGVVLYNYSGAYIAGGGGGGGSYQWGGGGGGAGGGSGGDSGPRHTTLSGGAGGAIGQAGSDGASWGSPYTDNDYCGSDGGTGDPLGHGGGAGGGGGTAIDTGSSCNVYMGTGGGGGRILPGTGGAGGDRGGNYRSASTEGGEGGSGGSAGQDGIDSYGNEDGAGGGGGWGAAGGDGIATGSWNAYNGAAGGAAISGTSITISNSGTIYGAT